MPARLLVVSEGIKKRKGNTKVIFGTYLMLAFGALVVFRGFNQETTRTMEDQISSSFRSLGTARSQKAFMFGGSAEYLEGTWSVKWLQYNSKTKKLEPYTIQDPTTGKMVPYPNDVVTISVDGPHLWCRAQNAYTTHTYWLEGRISSRRDVSLIYWSRSKPTSDELTGVLFLKLGNTENDKLKMEGDWIGYSRHEEVTHGRVVWRMSESSQ